MFVHIWSPVRSIIKCQSKTILLPHRSIMSLDNTPHPDTDTTIQNGFQTPAYPYTPTPTATLPYNTPDSGAGNALQPLTKDSHNNDPNKRRKKSALDVSNGFPYIEPVEADQKQLIEIIEEGIDNHDIIPPNEDSEDDSHNENTEFEHKQNVSEFNENTNLDNLKINIPSDTTTVEYKQINK